MGKRKLDAKTFANQKRKRRQWLTFMRMCRYGVNNFTRNIWLTVAATAVMTITLLIVFVTIAAGSVLRATVSDIRDKVDMSVYVRNEVADDDVQQIQRDIRGLDSVTRVTYVSPEQARANFAEQNKADSDTLDALNEATNRFPGTLRVVVADINDTSELRNYVETNQLMQANIDPNREPSFAGERRAAIENIGSWVEFADRVGLGASIVFVVISSLIVFNTIRMAIFNRKEEIQMMKLIGADRNFIRGPFIVEAVVYGLIAAILATVIGLALLYATRDPLLGYQVSIQPIIDTMMMYIGLVLLGMILLGSTIGIISSLFATRRYLKI